MTTGPDRKYLKWTNPWHVVALVQRPARLEVVPQDLVCPARPHLHARNAPHNQCQCPHHVEPGEGRVWPSHVAELVVGGQDGQC